MTTLHPVLTTGDFAAGTYRHEAFALTPYHMVSAVLRQPAEGKIRIYIVARERVPLSELPRSYQGLEFEVRATLQEDDVTDAHLALGRLAGPGVRGLGGSDVAGSFPLHIH